MVVLIGGDTIREINRVSGGFVELARQQNQGSNERVFNVRGTPDQIQHAVRLICEKAGLVSHCHVLSANYFLSTLT